MYLLRRSVNIDQRFDFFQTCERLGPFFFERRSAANFALVAARFNQPGQLRRVR